MDKEKTKKSYGMLISSMLIFGTIGIFRRYINLSSSLLACFRGLIGGIFLILFVKCRKRKILTTKNKKTLGLLILSGALIGLNWMFLFEAYNWTTVSVATLCYYMEPTIVILLCPIIFKEKLTLKNVICALISIIGMVFVSGVLSGGTFDGFGYKGVIYGLIAALLYSTVVLLNKIIIDVDIYEKTILQLLSAAFVLVPYILVTENFTAVKVDTIGLSLIIVLGIVHTGFAYAMYFGSMGCLKSQTVALLSYIDPVSALIFSSIFLQEKMTALGWLGAILIIGSAVFSEIKLKRSSS